MRKGLAIALMLVLAACQMTPATDRAPGAAPEPGITETALPDDGAALAPLPEPDPATDPAPVQAPVPLDIPAPTPPPDPPMMALERAACLRTGGNLMLRGGGLYACVHATRDAGRRCDAASDCQGLCLARSGTCAPFTPLYGCQEVFTAPGHRETLCID